MLDVVTGKEMKKIDDYTIHHIGIPSMVLMERAALALTQEIVKRPFIKNEKVLILCGTGNNGGDGIAIGRLLKSQDIKVQVIILGKKNKLSQETSQQLQIAKNLSVPIYEYNEINVLAEIEESDVIIDAIFGTGLSREIEGEIGCVIDKVNNEDAFVFSVDIPSGISSDCGKVLGKAIQANITVTFGLPKVGILMYPGAEYTGEVKIVDIGFPKEAYEQIKAKHFIYDKTYTKFLPKRKSRSNKGTYGKILVVAGSVNMSGAAYLSAFAAYRTGAGLVRILTEEENRTILQTNLPEAILTTYSVEDGDVRAESIVDVQEAIIWADVIIIGPGLGIEEKTKTLLKMVLQVSKGPIIIDADGLNVSADQMNLLRVNQPLIITPHPGEMARLVKVPIKAVLEDIISYGIQLSKEYELICVLKDARTIVANEKEEVFINTSGNHGMATAGAGDVLTGIIGALIGQGLDPYAAACLGVYIHGKAGDLAKRKLSTYSLTARDIIEAISQVMPEE